MYLKTKQDIIDQLAKFDVVNYAKTRNFVGGGVSEISPYITHGVISTAECVEVILQHRNIQESEKFLMELVWKEFFLYVQKSTWNWFLTTPIREDKTKITKKEILSKSVYMWKTETQRVNKTINTLVDTWLLHNHKRMWLASRCCHWAKLDWKKLADWTYFHFLDWELSSNHLSRQRVNSTFANKAYFMNEENLKKYRSWTSDEDIRWTYEVIFDKLFDQNRKSLYREENDYYQDLKTQTQNIKKRENKSISKTWWHIYILSPRKLSDDIFSRTGEHIIVLDTKFTEDHPRSQKRLSFVQSYADFYKIDFVIWNYQEIIETYIQAWYKVSLDERRDSVYKETQKMYIKNASVSILPYWWIYIENKNETILKFFKYWNKVKKHLKNT